VPRQYNGKYYNCRLAFRWDGFFSCLIMKAILNLMFALVICASLTVCCQSQPTQPRTNSTDSTGQTGEVLRNLIQDTVAISSLTDDDKAVLKRRYSNNRAVVSYRVINNPFPRPDSFAVFRKLRCNMSATRFFIAERTDLRIDNFSSNYLVWEGRLTSTGFISDRPDYSRIILISREDTTVQGGFRFSSGTLSVSNTELYEFEKFPPYDYFVLVQYNPNAGLVITDSAPIQLAPQK
jgi:hypothetical protein